MDYAFTKNIDKKHAKNPRRLTESNTGHLSIHTSSPFTNSVQRRFIPNQGIGQNCPQRHSVDLCNKNRDSDLYSQLFDDIINERFSKNTCHRNTYEHNNRNYITNRRDIAIGQCNRHKIVGFSYSTQSFKSKNFENQYATCSRIKYVDDSLDGVQNIPDINIINATQPQVTFNACDEINGTSVSTDIVEEKKYAEKSTYCRPVLNLYNQQFIYKTMERNDRLQRLLKNLVLARQREKQKEAWNNYINELKNKHGRYSGRYERTLTQYVPEEDITNELIDDSYNTRFRCQQSSPCQNLLEDIYGEHEVRPNYSCYNPQHYRPPKRSVFECDSYCYPTASQGRLMMLQSEKERNNLSGYLQPPYGRIYRNKAILVERDYIPVKREIPKKLSSKCTFTPHKQCSFIIGINSAIQTDDEVQCYLTEEQNYPSCSPELIKKQHCESLKEKYNRVSQNVLRLKKKVQESQYMTKKNTLSSIETKLDDLIKSINTFMHEVKSKKTVNLTRSTSVSRQCSFDSQKEVNSTKSDPFGLHKTNQIFCGMVTGTSKCDLKLTNTKYNMMKVDNILIEELNKSNKAKKDIEDMLNNEISHPESFRITFDIPTKERSTEVTDSLSKTFVTEQKNILREPGIAEDRCMTIAVNTDPLSLLALLRVSTETVKQLLSYMPSIEYNSYLPRLQLPQSTRDGVCRFICNICGANFGRPSLLSDHIESHNLGDARDCCVCRHVLASELRHSAGHFACQHCGKKFSRAYCCELHQQSCARRLGRRHDVTSSLMLLR